jgi:two-component system NtrC family sensor kinase
MQSTLCTELTDSVRSEGIKMMLDLPYRFQTHTMGLMRLYYNRKPKFKLETLRILLFLYQQGFCAVEKIRLIQEQQERYDHLALSTEKLSAIGRFAAGVAHEINNPLAGILLFSSSLLKQAPADSPFQEGLETITHEALRCKTIIQDLLEFSREKSPSRLMADLNEVVSKALNILNNEFHLKHIGCELKLAADLPEAMLDPGQIEQVMVNLLLNAIQATPVNGKIRIESNVHRDDNKLSVKVSDTGCGIPRRNLNSIFEPFFTTKSTGTGLGLAITYGIIQNHGGEISVVSKEGSGTSFIIELPLTDCECEKG